MRMPTFTVAGAARSGSTAVVEALRAHPHVFVTRPKEPHYYALAGQQVQYTGPGDDETINRTAVTEAAAWEALFEGAAPQHVARGDGSVSSLYLHTAAIPRMRATNMSMKVVIILRNPVDRAFSSYQYLRSRGYEPEPTFGGALDQETARRDRGWHHLWHYTHMGRYTSQVAAYFDAFGPDQVRLWLYEDFQAQPKATTAAMLDFLGVDPSLARQGERARVNVSGTPRHPHLHRALLWMASQDRIRDNVKRVVPFSARERVRRTSLRPDGVPTDERRRLEGLLADDVGALRELLGQPLPGWP